MNNQVGLRLLHIHGLEIDRSFQNGHNLENHRNGARAKQWRGSGRFGSVDYQVVHSRGQSMPVEIKGAHFDAPSSDLFGFGHDAPPYFSPKPIASSNEHYRYQQYET